MPYIKQNDKERLDPFIQQLWEQIKGIGEINYVYTRLAILAAGKEADYERFAKVYGNMLAAAAEFYRRAVVPYEDYKRSANGDVYK